MSISSAVPDVPALKAGAAKTVLAHAWKRDAEDFYSENISCSLRLFAAEPFRGTICDPCCGAGNIVSAARASGYESWGIDIIRRWEDCHGEYDFLTADLEVDNIVCNPPFSLAQGRSNFVFIRKALEVARYKVAMFLPHDFDASLSGAEFLKSTPYYRKWMIVPRPSVPPGHVTATGKKASNGKKNFSFYVWMHGFDGAPTSGWLTPDLLPTKEKTNG